MPDIFDEVATQPAPKDIFDEVAAPQGDIFDQAAAEVSPEVAAAAQNSATVAGQALDVATLPSKMDWRAANEHLDQQRYLQSEGLKAAAKIAEDQGSGTGPGSEAFGLRRQADFQREQMTPGSKVSRQLAAAGQADLRAINEVGDTAARQSTPSEMLSSFLGPGLSTTVQPVIESASRNLGGAAGGAAGAALGTAAATGVMGPLGLVPLIYGIGGAILGQHAGSAVEEKILQIGETPLETEQRQQRAAEDYAANPGLSKLGNVAANLPFFGPSLAQFARAGAGDVGAIRNIGIGGAIGGGLEAGMAKLRGEKVNPEDVAEAAFLGAVMNEPTALGRKLGLHPSSEQAAVEAAQKAYGVNGEKLSEIAPEPIGPQPGEPNAQQISETSPPDGGVRAPQVPRPNEPLPTAQGGEGVQPSGQGRPLAENAPEAPRKITLPAHIEDALKAREERLASGDTFGAKNAESRVLEGLLNEDTEAPSGWEGTPAEWEAQRQRNAEINAEIRRRLNPTQAEAAKVGPIRYDGVTQMGEDGFYSFTDSESKPGTAISFTVESKAPPTAEQIAEKHTERLKAFGVEPAQVSPQTDTAPAPPSSGEPAAQAGEQPPVGGPGAMGPIEAAEMQAAGKTTALKRAVVDTERLNRGAEDIPTPERLKTDQIVRNAEDAVDADPSLAPSIISRVVDQNQKAITHEEAAALLVERVRLSNETAAWEERKANGEDAGVADAHLAELERQAERLDRAQRAAGSEWSDVGRMYQNQLREDFTVDALKRKARATKKGPLTADETEKINEQAKQIKELQEKVDAGAKDAEKLREAQDTTRTMEATIKELQADRPKFGKQVFEIAHKIVDRWKVEAEAAHKSLRARLGQANVGLDPTIILDVAKIMRAKIGEFGLNAAETSTQILAELGEGVRPFLQKAWVKAQQLIDKEKMSAETRAAAKAGVKKKGERTAADALNRAKADAAAGDPLQSKTVYEIARSHINQGVHGEDAVMKATHETVKAVYPETTERDVRRAFSEYGKVKFPSKEATAKELRELRTLVRLQESIDRETEGLSALHTGLQRDKATQAIREKQAQLNELLKKRQGPLSPEQLATRDEARKTALKNQITDLDKQLQTGVKPVKSEPAPMSSETEALVSLRDAMREKLREIEAEAAPKKSEAEKQIEALSKQRQRVDDILSGKETPKTPKVWEALSQQAADIKSEILAMQELAAQMRRDAKPKTDPNFAKEQAQIKALEASIKNYEAKTAAGDFSAQSKLASRPDTEKVAALRAIKDARKAVYEAAKKAGKPVRSPEQVYNDTRLKAVQKQIEAADAMLKSGKFEKAPKPVLPEKNAAVRDAEMKLAEKKLEVRRGFEKQRLEKRTRTEKILDGIVKWRRTFVLTSPTTLGKLTSAAGEIIGIAPVEEAVGGVLSKLPGVRGIAEKAPRHGQFDWRAEGKAIAETWKNLLKDAGQAFRTGHTELDLLYGKPTIAPPELRDFVGNLHSALKTSAKRNEFTRSLEKRAAHAARAGLDVRDPVVQTRLATEAYKDALKSIFSQDNRVVSAYKRALTAFEQSSKDTGKPSLLGKTAAFGLKFTLPIVRIPTNIVARTFEYSLGTAAGSARIARAMWNGLDNLSEVEAEHIMSNLKRGSLGLAVMALGFFNPRNVGGYYQREERRSPGDVKPGELTIGGVTVPKWLIHNPLLEQLQIGATIRRVMDSRLRKHGDPQGLPAGIMAAAAGVLEETPFIREMEDTLKVLNPRERQTFLTELVQSASPQIVQWAAKQLDKDSQGEPVRRKPENMLQAVEMVTPGLRSNVPPAPNRH